MKSCLFTVCLWITFFAELSEAQIYADFSVSHGGTSLGTFRVRLDYDKAPRTCANFIGLANGQRAWLDTNTGQVRSGEPYYNGLKFHRLDHDFVIQGGDPRGNGSGGPGYVVQDEFHPALRHSGKYMLSMANSGTNTNGSQFFITLVATPNLDDKHSVFGEVIDDATHPNGRAIIDGFTNMANFPTTAESPDQPIVMDSVVISGPGLAAFDISDPALGLPVISEVKNQIAYDPTASEYKMTWDRKSKTEYMASFTTNLSSWVFLSSRYHLSMDSEFDWEYTVTGVTMNRFFSRIAEVDYGLVPDAPEDLSGDGNQVTVSMGDGESVTLAFDGAGGGTWSHSGGAVGTLSVVTWIDSAPADGYFQSSVPQAKFIPLGRLEAVFNVPVGTQQWKSVDFPMSFHTNFSGWINGSVESPVTGGGTTTVGTRVPFTWTPPPSP